MYAINAGLLVTKEYLDIYPISIFSLKMGPVGQVVADRVYVRLYQITHRSLVTSWRSARLEEGFLRQSMHAAMHALVRLLTRHLAL